jgi:nucleoside-diphosphate-sugar epimerase
MKLFVTGGTGFVGTHFLKRAIEEGHEVIAQRRAKSKTRLPLTKEPLWIDKPLDGDFYDALDGCEILIHLASHTPNPPYASTEECIYWNVYAPLKLAAQAAQVGIEKFLIAGSCFEYGLSAQELDFIEHNTTLKPINSYPTSKAAATIAFEGFAREHNLMIQIIRLFQVYGEGENENRFWPSLRSAAKSGKDFPMTKGEQIRDFMSVEEVASRFTKHLEFTDCHKGQPVTINLRSNGPQSLLSFAEFWWREWGAKGKLLPGAIPYRNNEIMRLVPR